MVGLWHDRTHPHGREFFDYTLDPDLAKRIGKITIVHATGDVANSADVQAVRNAVPGIEYIEVERDDHFKTSELPLLLEILFDVQE